MSYLKKKNDLKQLKIVKEKSKSPRTAEKNLKQQVLTGADLKKNYARKIQSD